jgi:hypothetical protein
MNAANTLRTNVPSFLAPPYLPTLTDEPRTSCLGGAFWVPEIGQPSSAVEFGKGGLDLTLAVDVEDIDSLDLLHVVAGAVDGNPTPRDFVAAVENIQSLEIERGLCAGAGDEIGLACEGN